MLNGAYLRAWQHPAGHQLQSLADRAGLLRSLRQSSEPDQQRTDAHLRGRTHTYADGHTVKEVRPRYSCFYKIRHPGDCDGQSGYGVSKLDSIVEEVVRQIFVQFREVSRKNCWNQSRPTMPPASRRRSRKSRRTWKPSRKNWTT